jgi:non-ribosomal peptide synthetase component F
MHQLNNMTASSTQTVNNISMISGNDMDEILGWNKETLQISNSEDCIHRIIAQQAIKRPQAQAVNAWDESFTYSQLTNLSNTLSHHLKALGLGPNQFVPLCFNKSAWAIVAILAVLKSGAAYVPLDPKYPKKRRDHIIQEVSAKIILLEPQHRSLFDSSAYFIQEVDRESVESLPDQDMGGFDSGNPNDAAFLVFSMSNPSVFLYLSINSNKI